MNFHIFLPVLKSLSLAFKHWRVITSLGYDDIKLRYKRSILGPFWITINQAVLGISLGYIFGMVFNQSMRSLLPSILIGLTIWGFISSSLTDACMSFIQSRDMILNLRLSSFTYVLRTMFRNLIIFVHNVAIIPVLYLFYDIHFTSEIIDIFIVLILITLNLIWVSIILAFISVRYRDVPLIVQNFLQIFFYVTPIVWMTSQLSLELNHAILYLNPFFHFVEAFRAPLLGGSVSNMNWLFLILPLIPGFSAALISVNFFERRIFYWI